jgi:antitoxin VapB
MSLQIANPVVIAKVERLSRATGLSKTALVERALDCLAATLQRPTTTHRLPDLLRLMDAVPERAGAADPLQWDADGLPT